MPFTLPGDLPDSGIKLASLVSPALQADSLPFEPPCKPKEKLYFSHLRAERHLFFNNFN